MNNARICDTERPFSVVVFASAVVVVVSPSSSSRRLGEEYQSTRAAPQSSPRARPSTRRFDQDGPLRVYLKASHRRTSILYVSRAREFRVFSEPKKRTPHLPTRVVAASRAMTPTRAREDAAASHGEALAASTATGGWASTNARFVLTLSAFLALAVLAWRAPVTMPMRFARARVDGTSSVLAVEEVPREAPREAPSEAPLATPPEAPPRDYCLERLGSVELDASAQTWRYPPECAGRTRAFDAVSARETLAGKSFLFLGNSVCRRLLYAVAHVAGGENATSLNASATGEIIQDMVSHRYFEVGIDASGRCSKQYACSTSHREFTSDPGDITETSLVEMFNCEKDAWVEKRRAIGNSETALGFIFTGTPVLPTVERALALWTNFGDSSFAASPMDNYDVFILQTLIVSETDDKYFESLAKSFKKLIDRREALGRPIQIVLWGSPHVNASQIDTSTILQVLDKFRPYVRDMGVTILDVTSVTAQAIELHLGRHQEGSRHHFMDFTRLMLADMLLNTIRAIS
jgi:hypothetical protein